MSPSSKTTAVPTAGPGKCNAARLGADRATGQWILFTDADTWFDPELVRASVAVAEERGAGLLSILSSLTYGMRFEQLAQPVASFVLVQMYPLERVDHPTRARPFANGQFLLFRQSVYSRIGGHAAVKDDLLEDIAFARLVHSHDERCGLVLADGMLVCSMYDSIAAFREGWKRIFIEACKRKPRRLRRLGWRVLALGIGLPLIQVVAMVVGLTLLFRGDVLLGTCLSLVSFAGLVVMMIAVAMIYGISGCPRRMAWLFPSGSWVVGRLLLSGAEDLERRRPVKWGGREYVLEPRS